MKRSGGMGKWAFLAIGVAAIHFVAMQVSMFAIMARAISGEADNWRWAAARQLFVPLAYPAAWLVTAPWNKVSFEFGSFNYFALMGTNSLLWGGCIAFLMRWIARRLASAARRGGKL